jgi:cytochrome c oxidase subunit IV
MPFWTTKNLPTGLATLKIEAGEAGWLRWSFLYLLLMTAKSQVSFKICKHLIWDGFMAFFYIQKILTAKNKRKPFFYWQ